MFKFDESMIGRKVRFVNAKLHKQFPSWFPAVGTIGEIRPTNGLAYFDGSLFVVEWPEDTVSWPCIWACNEESLELVEEVVDKP